MERKSSELSSIQQFQFFFKEQIFNMILVILLNFTLFSRGETMASQTQNIFDANIHWTLIWA